ncbi:MAG: hypothetical protein NC938_06025 [Candidatus Omnitrophica bacterium]|nr:hypothetical protein [Candidatus Omnitrophota bacterium]MCM8791234.1 hypothetical protein [Candidatus Omnitrophota bacterium]
MIKKEELLRLLKEAMDMEEKSVPVYMNHLKAALFWVGMEQDKAEKVKEHFKYLAACSTKHQNIVLEVIDKVTKEGRSAY